MISLHNRGPISNMTHIHTNLLMLKHILSFSSHARYTFELSRRTHLPEVFLSKILEPTLKSLAECCDSGDATGCMNAQVPLPTIFFSNLGRSQGLENCSSWARSDPVPMFVQPVSKAWSSILKWFAFNFMTKMWNSKFSVHEVSLQHSLSPCLHIVYSYFCAILAEWIITKETIYSLQNQKYLLSGLMQKMSANVWCR